MQAGFDTTLAGLGIGRTTDANAAAINSAASSSASLKQGDFLRLMTAQLNNQDPFEPIDNTQMVAQLAQFSSLSGQEETNSTLAAIADKLGATSKSEALGFVGRTVLTEGSIAYPRADGGLDGAIELDANATTVNVTISAGDGRLLRTVDLGAQDAGAIGFDWGRHDRQWRSGRRWSPTPSRSLRAAATATFPRERSSGHRSPRSRCPPPAIRSFPCPASARVPHLRDPQDRLISTRSNFDVPFTPRSPASRQRKPTCRRFRTTLPTSRPTVSRKAAPNSPM